jgi:WD40 repeat protein
MFASTLFRSALYHPDESQILTCGSDRKLTYWDAFDGSAIRILEGSTAEINTIDVTNDGAQFVSAGNDKQVKLWDYDEGICRAIGEGHSGYINQIMISPDQKNIVSVGAEGAIFIWKMPSRAGEGKESKK